MLKRALSSPGNHVWSACACIEVRDLKTGRLKVFVACVPGASGQLHERRCERVNRIVRKLRVCDVALNAMHRQAPAQRATSSDLDGVAELRLARWFADDAQVDPLATRFEHFDDATCPVH